MVTAESVRIAAKEIRRRDALKELQRRKLYEFFKGAWETLEPNRKLDTNWHLELLCEYLELVHSGDVKKLLVNIAPRHLKSKLITIAFPCWEWLHKPHLRYMCLSYASSLAIDHNQERQKLITSDWYQSISGGMLLSRKKNRMTEFENDKGGVMLARGLDGSVLGSGGDRIICDDGNIPDVNISDHLLQQTINKFKDYSITRRDSPQDTAVINIQQRVNDNDISGFIIRELRDYIHVNLPTRCEKRTVIEFPKSKRLIIREVGDILHPSRFTQKDIEEAERSLGQYMFACRHQQNPSPSEGGIFKRFNWMLYAKHPRFHRKYLSVDSNFKKTESGSFVVIQTWGQHQKLNPYGKYEYDYYFIPNQFRNRSSYNDTEKAIRERVQTMPELYKILIEDKANGSTLIERLSSEFPNRIEAINPGSDSKEARASAISPIHERKSICLPIDTAGKAVLESLGRDSISVEEWWSLYPPNDRSSAKELPLADWIKDMVDRFALFPNVEFNDEIDATSQAITWGEQQPFQVYSVGSLGDTKKLGK